MSAVCRQLELVETAALQQAADERLVHSRQSLSGAVSGEGAVSGANVEAEPRQSAVVIAPASGSTSMNSVPSADANNTTKLGASCSFVMYEPDVETNWFAKVGGGGPC